MKDVKVKNTPIDWKLFESVITYNSLTNETYLASIIDFLDSKFFANPDIRLILNIVTDFYKNRNTVPNITEIKLHLTTPEQKEAFKRVVSDFASIDKTYDFTSLVVNTERFFREKSVQNALLEVAESYSKNQINTNQIYDQFSKACNISLVDNLGCDYFNDVDKHLQELCKNNRYISTGFPWLDQKTGGGLLEDGRALYIVSGATNSGKSIMLGNIAANIVAQDKTVIIISLEMSETVYAKRISSHLSQIPLNKVALQTDSLKLFIEDYKNRKLNARLFIKEYAPKEVTVNHIRAYIQQLINKKGIKPDAIVVDYINLIQPTLVTGNSYTDNKAVTEQLRALSYVFNVPVISAVQLNRSGYDKANPGLETISESIGISMTADVQFAVWSNEQDKDLGIIHIGMQKNRYGQNFGTKALRINYDTLSIYETNDDAITNQDVMEADNAIDTILNGLSVDIFNK